MHTPAGLKRDRTSPLNVQIAGEHYNSLSIQPVEFIYRNGLGFIEGSVIEYVCRHKQKNGKQDLEKAIHFLQVLIELAYPDDRPE